MIEVWLKYSIFECEIQAPSVSTELWGYLSPQNVTNAYGPHTSLYHCAPSLFFHLLILCSLPFVKQLENISSNLSELLLGQNSGDLSLVVFCSAFFLVLNIIIPSKPSYLTNEAEE